VVKSESSIMKQIQCKPYPMANWRSRNNKQDGASSTSCAWDTFKEVLLSECLLYVVLYSVTRQSRDQLSSNEKNLTS